MPKKRLLLFLLIITALSLMTYQSNREPLLPLKFLNNALNWFHDIKHSVKDSITSPFKRIFLKEEENIRLKEDLNNLLKERQKYREALLENKRLRELLSLKEKEHRYVTAARVIARGTDQWSNTFVLDKGLSDGVTKDMLAITHRGLAGKISSVSGSSYSTLLLLTDINFSSAARLQETRIEGVLSGTGFRKCLLKYIPYEEKVEKGNTVITSGLDSLFPQGIPIGYVSKVNKKGTGLFQDIEVLPFEDTSKIEELVIIKKE
jgi:rod shape-determining protein MreC